VNLNGAALIAEEENNALGGPKPTHLLSRERRTDNTRQSQKTMDDLLSNQ